MRFTSKTDINAPLNASFAAIADFEAYERHANRTGAEGTRVDALSRPGPGMMWAIRMELRGKLQKIEIELADYEPPNKLIFTGGTDSFDAEVLVELIALSARETRATMTVDLKPKTLAARLILQSARLTKGSITKRIRKRLNKFALEIEDRVNTA